MTDAAVRTHGLTKRYGSVEALVDLDLQIERGEVFGYLGPNGAGKTTTIRLLLATLRPTAGTAEVLGLDPWGATVELHRRCAFVPGEFPAWPNLTGEEMLDLLGHLAGGWDPARRAELVERFEFDPTTKGRAYSKGNRQKIALIAGFQTRAELVILDEPTAGLDPLMERRFRELLADVAGEGATVLLSSHMLAEVEAACDRIGILRAGRLVEVGPLSELRIGHASSVEVVFDGAVPPLEHVPGVADVAVDGAKVQLTLEGEPGPLLAALAGHHVLSLSTKEPTLEEVFLAYYGGGS